MKKFIFLLALSAILLQSCSSIPVWPKPTPRPPYTEINTEYILENNTGNKELDESCLLSLNDFIGKISLKHLFNPVRMETLINSGVEISLEKVYKVDNDNLLLTYKLTNKDGKTLTVEMPAILTYSINLKTADNFEVFRGNISVNENEVIVTKYNGIEIYSLDTFERKNKTPDLSFALEKENRLLIDSIGCADKYIVAYSCGYEKNCIYFFDGELNLLGECDSIRFVNEKSSYFNKRYVVNSKYSMEWLDKEKQYFVFSSKNKDDEYQCSHPYNTQTMEHYDVGAYCSWTNGDYRTELLCGNQKSMSYTDYFAIRRKGGIVTDVIPFKQDKFPQLFKISDIGPVYNEDMTIVEFKDDKNGISVTIDFINDKVSVMPYKDGLKNTDSRQGDTELIRVVEGYYRPYYHAVYAYNYNTDKTVHLGTFEPEHYNNYNAIKNIGFLPNGNIFVEASEEFRIFDGKTYKQLFSVQDILGHGTYNIHTGEKLPENINASHIDRVYCKIHDIRRDPVDGTLLVLHRKNYFKRNVNSYSHEVNLYHIDTKGNILTTYSIDKELADDGFGYIRLTGPHTVRMTFENPFFYGVSTIFEYDLQTRTYNMIEDNREAIRRYEKGIT